MKARKKVVVIGGGTGTYTILLGLKKYNYDISVIVTMTDSGGSNRVIRDEFGLLPTSDIRQAMVALASENVDDLYRKLFTYRYHQGTGLNGMTFGNLFMLALTDILGSQKEALSETCRLLGVKGNIIPVTFDNSQLLARYDNGKQVLGEHSIDEPSEEFASHRIIELETIPQAHANPEAIDAIMGADIIVFAPGDLYTSLLSNIIVKGIREAVIKSRAKRIYIVNLMTKHGQTNHFKASDFCLELSKFLKGHNPDYILINKPMKLSRQIAKRYEEERAEIVTDDLDEHWENLAGSRIIRKDFTAKEVFENAKGDKLRRSLIRHDSDTLAKIVSDIASGKI
ncbi:MAG: hypothetical protein UX12_C0020G0010 [Candidatus Collierbacteria bacterium GW2011_GWC1_45_47]|uniref:Gluconeogenesis factor n=5 Tax=Candidatus Collieribacteriota TaxID=1752725 RepID=A0A0G1JRW8_9BACT|nr:MAG: hypothetical protein UW23_C0010G0010 [Candidatus Collierbacteria bacterium GW2011_GWA1_44_12]KKT39330.1 MAG: hypothetical protein UW26_C0004G0017 [Candidatus Collierbacteria bacterium GW2011_GWF1_44_12]KKT46647.1 MAG: hypothetical protein UW35_C0010G0004 [Candidatus Collierbacteria bacterium GW2011_GWF2_44_15]KKU00303.1 MAG: hypothetical protein UW99_C0002G0005 [Candidatus Collierbacteria bacterium GW2011_GWC2_45_15]KKU09201.1 MAG: hypothetical protein UX12_C0020G0010 [Candidatus Collie